MTTMTPMGKRTMLVEARQHACAGEPTIATLPPRDRKDTKEVRRSGSQVASAAAASRVALSGTDSSPSDLGRTQD